MLGNLRSTTDGQQSGRDNSEGERSLASAGALANNFVWLIPRKNFGKLCRRGGASPSLPVHASSKASGSVFRWRRPCGNCARNWVLLMFSRPATTKPIALPANRFADRGSTKG